MNILYSIPIHECTECIKQMCDGILFYDSNATIILHVSKSSNIKLFKQNENDKIIINPTQFDTNWGWDFTRIHVSNYLYIKKNIEIDYVIFLTSNMLMVKNPSFYIKNYESGFNNPYIDQKSGWLDDVRNNKIYLNILDELNTKNMYGCIIDGSYVNKYIMDKICYFYEKYFNYELVSIHSLEEKIIPTIACNLSNKISDSLCYFNSSIEGVTLNDLERVKNVENGFFIKRVLRDMSNAVRQKYNNLIYEKS